MKKLIKLIISIAILAGIVYVFYPVISDKLGFGRELITFNDVEVTIEDFEGSLKQEMSEIDGMSKYDKLQMGLDPNVVDSDHDGLSDDDEINVYHSDPTKMSTSGDFYTDKYKVDNNMDINTQYEYTGNISYEFNDCPEVSLAAKTIEEMFAVVESMDLRSVPESSLGNLNVYKAYKIYNYGGSLDIDVSDIVNDEVTIGDLALYISGIGNDVDKLDFKANKDTNVLSTKAELDFNEMNYVYVVSRGKGVSNGNAKKILTDLNYLVYTTAEEATDNVDVKVVVRCRPALGWICASLLHKQNNAKIYYVDCGDPAKNEKAIQRMLDSLNYMYSFRPQWGPFTVDSEAVEAVSDEKYSLLVNGYEVADVSGEHRFEGDVKNQPFYQWLTYCYYTYDDTRSFEFDYSSGQQVRYQANKKLIADKFDFNEDTLPFGNFATKISPQGTCMGVSMLTTKVFNTGSVPIADSYKYGGDYGLIKWDLSAEENTTLFDKGLNDYKNEKFVRERITDDTLIITPRTEGEAEFIKMAGCYWKEGNDIIKKKCHYCEKGVSNDYYPGLEEVLKEMDEGKILICGLGDETGAHAVVVYDYQKSDDGTIIFNVYDNNYYTDKSLYLTITPKRATYGNHDSFEYEYKTEKYEFTSNTDDYFILFMDEKGNVLYPSMPKAAK